jgi:hypothetical protein
MRLTALLPLCVPILSALPYPTDTEDSACPSSASACPLLPEQGERDERQAPVHWPEAVPLGPLLDSVREEGLEEKRRPEDREEMAWMIT